MSKKRKVTNVQDTLQSIQDLVTSTKAKLEDETARGAAIKDLYNIAELAIVVRDHLKISKDDRKNYDDELDAQGVNLWNASGVIKQAAEDDSLQLIAALRLAAFRLIEGGMEAKPSPMTLRHILKLSSKTGTTLLELGKHDIANTVLISAAEYERALRAMSKPDDENQIPNLCAIVVYYSARMQAAWKEWNTPVAEYMSKQILEIPEFSLLPMRERESVAIKHVAIGKALLKPDQKHETGPHNAVHWLQTALKILETFQDAQDAQIGELKISTLRALARAYFLSSDKHPENLSRAEVTLEELFALVDALDDRNSDYQELRWQRIAVLKKRKADVPTLLQAFRSLIGHMSFSESDVANILQELRLFNIHSLVTSVHQHCIEEAIKARSTHMDKILLSLTMHCSRDNEHRRAMSDLKHALDLLSEATYDLSPVSAAACLTVLWKYGRACFTAKKWAEAADWYLIGTHPIFQAINSTSLSKCFRKAALCHIEQGEFATAGVVMRNCHSGEAATHYISFLIAVKQGLEAEALEAIKSMAQAPDFDRKLLLSATKLAHESDMHPLLLSALEMLYETLKFSQHEEPVSDALTLIRCIIRLLLQNTAQPSLNQKARTKALLKHFRTARDLIRAAQAENAFSIVIKDTNWLWRTAYNTAVTGCSEWEDGEDDVADLFDISRELLEAVVRESPVDTNASSTLHIINAYFSGVSARVISFRKTVLVSDINIEAVTHLLAQVRSCGDLVRSAVTKSRYGEDAAARERLESFTHVLVVFEVELLSAMKDWAGLLDTVKKATQAGSSATATFGAITDIIWAEKSCPTEVLFSSLENVLHASLDKQVLSVVKFSRWLRAMCTIVLTKWTSEGRLKAVGYVEQAITVIEENCDGDDAYPLDERQWLLGTAYNAGLECFQLSLLDEGRRWLEAATVLCRFVPNGKAHKAKISETYSRILARHSAT